MLEKTFYDLLNSILEMNNADLSQELDFFFDNVMDTVVNYFKEEVVV